jgi:hypothetical protein
VIKITPPCEQCPIHLRGIEKSGEICRNCPARLAYTQAIGDDNILMGHKPLPDMTPPPEAEHIYTNADAASGVNRSYNYGPRFFRKTLKRARDEVKNPVGRPPELRTVMAARRVELGLSQGDVADLALSTVRTIASLESGCYLHTPKPSTLKAVAAVLKISPARLLEPWRGKDESANL